MTSPTHPAPSVPHDLNRSLDFDARLTRLEETVEANLNLSKLSSELSALQRRNPSIDLLFKMIDRYPAAFSNSQTQDASHNTLEHTDDPSPRHKATIIMGHASLLTATADQIAQIPTLYDSLPTLSTSHKLTRHTDALRELSETVDAQVLQVEDLRTRTIAVLDRWYRSHVRLVNEELVSVGDRMNRVHRVLGVLRDGD